MKASEYLKELSVRSGIKSSVLLILAASIVANCLLAIVLITKKTEVRVILTPPEIRKTMWVDDDKISKEYLGEMAIFITQLMLNATPGTVTAQHNVFMRYVDPAFYDDISRNLAVTCNFIKENNIATWFVPLSISVDEKANQVTLEGDFQVSQGTKVTEKARRKLTLIFKYQNGRTLLKALQDSKVIAEVAKDASAVQAEMSANTLSDSNG